MIDSTQTSWPILEILSRKFSLEYHFSGLGPVSKIGDLPFLSIICFKFMRNFRPQLCVLTRRKKFRVQKSWQLNLCDNDVLFSKATLKLKKGYKIGLGGHTASPAWATSSHFASQIVPFYSQTRLLRSIRLLMNASRLKLKTSTFEGR